MSSEDLYFVAYENNGKVLLSNLLDLRVWELLGKGMWFCSKISIYSDWTMVNGLRCALHSPIDFNNYMPSWFAAKFIHRHSSHRDQIIIMSASENLSAPLNFRFRSFLTTLTDIVVLNIHTWPRQGSLTLTFSYPYYYNHRLEAVPDR